jgi:hypothetical protein
MPVNTINAQAEAVRGERQRAVLAAALNMNPADIHGGTMVSTETIVQLQRQGRIGSKMLATGANVPVSEVLKALLP